jgi:hypothetical protein
VETFSLTDLVFSGLLLSGLCAEALSRWRAGRPSGRPRSLADDTVAVGHDRAVSTTVAPALTSTKS